MYVAVPDDSGLLKPEDFVKVCMQLFVCLCGCDCVSLRMRVGYECTCERCIHVPCDYVSRGIAHFYSAGRQYL
jgi:hypothetical protein